jgi:cytochrome c-type biogenesis protein CcmF
MKSIGESAALALFNLSFKNTRRYGGYIVHFGMVLIFVALAGAAFNKETEKDLATGEAIKIAGYELKCEGIKEGDTPNYSYSIATMQVLKDGHLLTTMLPEKRLYKASQQPASEVALHSTLREDLYVVYKGQADDGAKAVIQVYINPLVTWLWIGGLVVVLGTGMALLPNRIGRSRKAGRRNKDGHLAEAEEPEYASIS